MKHRTRIRIQCQPCIYLSIWPTILLGGFLLPVFWIYKLTMVSDTDILKIGQVLRNCDRPLKERFRALFTLRNIGGKLSISEINSCFSDKSALLKHELAYCLGQMKDKNAIPYLIKVLENKEHEPMVRHEAAEALGAIGCPSVEPTLMKYSEDSVVEVAETCHLALGRINWLKNENNQEFTNKIFNSIDPTPPSEETDIKKLQDMLTDESLTLYERYKAMFSLRNLNSPQSAKALAAGFKCSSALFRHEIGYVLGQMACDEVVQDLITVVKNVNESEMVRHEAAEAMGCIANKACIACLEEYKKDSSQVVAESCIVALDMSDYENSSEFQYANTLVNLHKSS